jgi:multiple sugar transport system permease protein
MTQHIAYPGPQAFDAAKQRRSFRYQYHRILGKRSTLAFVLVLPLIVLLGGLIVYPFFYAIYLSFLNRSETAFVGFRNYAFLFKRDTFWMVVQQSFIFALSAVFFKMVIGFILAHAINELPNKRQRLWRGLVLVPWVMPPALSTLGWWWLFEPSYSAINWLLTGIAGISIPWLSDPFWARFAVILVNVWYGAPFFMIMYLAGLKSVPADLYEAASIDGATAIQKMVYVTIPMMRNIIAITVLFSIIVTFANFDIVRVLTDGGPRDMTHLFGTWSFRLGIQGGDIPLAAAVSLFLFPLLAVLAIFILRNVSKRTQDI